MCNLLSPQREVMSFSYDGASGSLAKLSRTFLATIVDAKDFICQVETAFSNDLWPAIDAELANSRRRVMELERHVEESSRQLEEREQLQYVRESERDRLLSENGALRAELEQLSRHVQEGEERLRMELCKQDERERLLSENRLLQTELDRLSRLQAERVQNEGTSMEAGKLVHENQILQNKIQLLLEENLDGEKRRKNLVQEVGQLQEEAKLSTIKEMALEAENKKFARARSRIEKSEVEDAKRLSVETIDRKFALAQPPVPKTEDLDPKRLSSRWRKELAKDGSPCSETAGRDMLPVSPEDPQDSKNAPLVQSVSLQDFDRGVDHAASDLGKKEEMRDRSPVDPGAEIAVNGAIPFDNPPLAEANCQRDPVADPEAEDVQEIMCSQRPTAHFGAESSPAPRPGFVDSDAATTLGLDAVQDDFPSASNFEDYPLISIASETQAGPCGDEPLQLPSRNVSEVTLRGGAAKQMVEEDRDAVQSSAPLVLMPIGLSRKRPLPRTKVTARKPAKKRKDQSWIRTRHRTKPSDKDPHDSFLDTPRETVLAQLLAAKGQEPRTVKGGIAPVTSKLDGGSLEARGGEQAVPRQENPSASLRPILEVSNAGRSSRTGAKAPALKAPPVKFNEPVRKKSDREALKGTDCQQCRKFYEAVQAGNASGLEACEHYNNVSRHRFKYIPPATPEGFWNIGFDDTEERTE